MGKYGEGVDEFSSSPTADGSSKVHVLVVDDNSIDRKLAERLLENTSCTVTTVDCVRSALEFLGLDEKGMSSDFHEVKVDLIVTDYCMPEMTGYDLLKKIKGSSYYREVPVVIMSSENVSARKDRCLEEGAEEFIVKPMKLTDVQRFKKYMYGGEEGNPRSKNDEGISKRKLQETSYELSSSSSSPSPPNSMSMDFSSPSSDAVIPPSSLTAMESPSQ